MELTLWTILRWTIRLVMIPFVARRHEPTHATAWLAPIFLFPVVGTLCYFWLARFGVERSARRHRRVRESVETPTRRAQQERHRLDESVAPEHRDLIRLGDRLITDRIGGFPVLSGNRVELLGTGEMFDALVADIDGAEHHVHLLFYMFLPDATGRRVADALARAEERGVQCRVLWDRWASRKSERTLGERMRAQGIEVHSVLPMIPIRQPLSRIDVRNHRKIAVIDGRVAYTGSHNIHDASHDLDEGEWKQISCASRARPRSSCRCCSWRIGTSRATSSWRARASFPSPGTRAPFPCRRSRAGPATRRTGSSTCWCRRSARPTNRSR
jgi:cardiolipin synthase